MKKPLGVAALVISTGVLLATASFGSGQATPWAETFDGDPSSPRAWSSPDWDIQYHTRQAAYWAAPESMDQQHGGGCDAPPMTHPASSWPGTVYQCRNHVMTAINATEYGLIYLTPNRLVDFTGSATIEWEMSTENRSGRDWVDLVITPWEYNQATTLVSSLSDGVDLQGAPRYAVHVGMDNGEGAPLLGIVREGQNQIFGTGSSVPRLNAEIPSSVNQAAARQPFRLTLTATSAKFERLASATAPALVYWNHTFPALPFSEGVVQFGHHSYTPWKDGNGGPQTYHWDNVKISPSTPFTMVKANQRYLGGSGGTITFDSPAPANSYLRFSALGSVEVSLNGGPYAAAQRQWEVQNRAEGASSYWHPVAQGTSTVQFRLSARSWFNGPFIAKDFAIWSSSAASGSLPQLPPATATPTAQPATATPTATSTPTSTQPVTNATPTSTPTAVVSTPSLPSPTATATPPRTNEGQSWTTTANSSSSSVPAGGRIALAAQAKPRLATTALIDIEVYDPSGRKVFQQYWDRRSFKADKARSFSALWRVPSSAQKGTYTVKVGIFGVRWNGLEFWNDSATTFTVR